MFKFSVAQRHADRADGHLELAGRPPACSQQPCDRSQPEPSLVSPLTPSLLLPTPVAASPETASDDSPPLLWADFIKMWSSFSLFRYRVLKPSGPSEAMREMACGLKAPYFLFQENLPK